jgi:arylformamidase
MNTEKGPAKHAAIGRAAVKRTIPWPLVAFATVVLAGAWLRDPQPSGAQAASRNDAAMLRDVAYGPHARHRYDVYAPAKPMGAPTIFYVHGGGWRRGDKAHEGLISTKQRRWTAAGAFVVSTNYRFVPDADPVQQARDVGRAIAAAQTQVAKLGGDPNAFVVMGHSAGAHLVSLLASSPEMLRESGAKPWRGQVLLDSGAIDVVATMRAPRRLGLFETAFGNDPAFWREASPVHRLNGKVVPTLAVCAQERIASCASNRQYLEKAKSFGTRTQLMPVPLNHAQINRNLGEDNTYTRDVEAFIRGLGVRLGG